MQFEDASAFVGRRPGGQDVVNQQDMCAAETASALECPDHVLAALLGRQAGLAEGRPRALQAVQIEGNFVDPAQVAGDLCRLVETTLLDAFRMQR